MKAATHTAAFDSYSVHTRATPLSLQPMPKTNHLDDPDDLRDDVRFLRVLDLTDDFPTPAPLPEKRHPVLDVSRMVVSANHMRRIEYELKHDECDLRTVFSACRGLKRGTIEFENAYIAARIRSFVKHQRVPADPLPCAQTNADDPPQNPLPNTMKQNTPPLQHPLAVNHPADLMSHLGIWVIALLGSQAWASWRISAFADVYLEGGRFLYFAIGIILMLALDSVVWFRRRGRLFDAFFAPGAMLFLLALLPVFILHVREALLAMHASGDTASYLSP